MADYYDHVQELSGFVTIRHVSAPLNERPLLVEDSTGVS